MPGQRRRDDRARARARASGIANSGRTEGHRGRGEAGERLVARDVGREHRAERDRRAEREAAEHLPDESTPDRAALDARDVGGSARSSGDVSHAALRVARGVAQHAEPGDLDLDESPATNGPTPAGVPVRITSPGSSVNTAEA